MPEHVFPLEGEVSRLYFEGRYILDETPGENSGRYIFKVVDDEQDLAKEDSEALICYLRNLLVLDPEGGQRCLNFSLTHGFLTEEKM